MSRGGCGGCGFGICRGAVSVRPVAPSEGGGINPNQSAENKQKRILISTPTLYNVHYVKLFMGYPQVCKQLCA